MSAATTAKLPRRVLRFDSVAQMLAEVDRIVAADSAGTLRRAGNWTAGQAFGHLAAWINYGYDGYPMQPPPWFVRVILKAKLKSMLRDGMPVGVRIPRAPEGTYGTEVLATTEGVSRLRAAVDRMQREAPRFHSPAFGKLSDQDRLALVLRHAELHLGFLHY